MRKFTDGSGADSTAAVKTYMAGTSQPIIFTFVRIELARWIYIPPNNYVGEGTASQFANTWLLTDAPAAVSYTPLGIFRAANVKHGSLEFSIGLSSQDFEVEWSPSASDLVLQSGFFPASPNIPYDRTVPSINVAQAVQQGFFDGAHIYVYKCVMPSVFDANTYGVTLMTMGIVDEIGTEDGKLTFKSGSPFAQSGQKIPSQVIGPNSRFAPADPLFYNGLQMETRFAERATTTVNLLTSGNWSVIFGSPDPDGRFNGGVVVWADGPLAGMRRPVARSWTEGGTGNGLVHFELAEPYPFDNNQYSDVYSHGMPFVAYPLTALTVGSPGYDGFPYVPMPEDAL